MPVNQPKRRFGVAGVIVGMLALAAAFLSPWIAKSIDPPSKPLEERAVNFADKLKDAAAAKLKGKAYVPASTPIKVPSRFLFPGVIGLGMLGVALGVMSLLRAEPKGVARGAIALGVSAAVVQWSILLAGAFLFLLVVFAVLAFFD